MSVPNSFAAALRVSFISPLPSSIALTADAALTERSARLSRRLGAYLRYSGSLTSSSDGMTPSKRSSRVESEVRLPTPFSRSVIRRTNSL